MVGEHGLRDLGGPCGIFAELLVLGRLLESAATAGMAAKAVGVVADDLGTALALGNNLARSGTGLAIIHLPDSGFRPSDTRHGGEHCS